MDKFLLLARRAKWQREYAARNPEKVRAGKVKWAKNNKERVNEISRAWRKSNPEKAREVARRHARNHPESVRKWCREHPQEFKAIKCVDNAKRRAAQRSPAWANTFFIKETYRLAQLRTRVTGIKWEVDHIVPLTNKIVCGLHAENNLRVVPSSINRRKSNHLQEQQTRAY